MVRADQIETISIKIIIFWKIEEQEEKLMVKQAEIKQKKNVNNKV